MRMKKTVVLTMALLIVVGVLAGCRGRSTLKVGWRGSNVGRRTWARYGSFTGVERKTLRLEAGQTLELIYDVEVDKGTLTLSLIDPDGETVWEETFEEAQADELDLSISQSGRHRLHVEGEATGGSYDVSWDVVED